MSTKRFDWTRGDDGMRASTTVGSTTAAIWRDTDQKKGFAWEMYGFAPDREAALEAVEKALLGSLSTEMEDPQWLKKLMQAAVTGDAYIVNEGIRDTRTLMVLCKLALAGTLKEPTKLPSKNFMRRPRRDPNNLVPGERAHKKAVSECD